MKPFINQFDARFVSRWTERFYKRVAPELAGDRSAKDTKNALPELPATVGHPRVFHNRMPEMVDGSYEGRREYGALGEIGYSEWYREFAGKRTERHQGRQTCLRVGSITAT